MILFGHEERVQRIVVRPVRLNSIEPGGEADIGRAGELLDQLVDLLDRQLVRPDRAPEHTGEELDRGCRTARVDRVHEATKRVGGQIVPEPRDAGGLDDYQPRPARGQAAIPGDPLRRGDRADLNHRWGHDAILEFHAPDSKRGEQFRVLRLRHRTFLSSPSRVLPLVRYAKDWQS